MDRGNATGSTSLLSKEVKIEGDIQGSENLQVEGQFKGSIKLAGDVYVGPTGIVEADVEADNIVIQGQINGNVMARNQLQIQSAEVNSIILVKIMIHILHPKDHIRGHPVGPVQFRVQAINIQFRGEIYITE